MKKKVSLSAAMKPSERRGLVPAELPAICFARVVDTGSAVVGAPPTVTVTVDAAAGT